MTKYCGEGSEAPLSWTSTSERTHPRTYLTVRTITNARLTRLNYILATNDHVLTIAVRVPTKAAHGVLPPHHAFFARYRTELAA